MCQGLISHTPQQRWGGRCFHPHFTERQIVSQVSEVTCLNHTAIVGQDWNLDSSVCTIKVLGG